MGHVGSEVIEHQFGSLESAAMRRLLKLLVMAGLLAAVLAWREQQIAANQRRFDLPG